MEKKKFKILSKNLEKDNLFLTLAPIDGKNIEFKAGQFVKISSPRKSEDPTFRFYSIISIPFNNNLEFIIKIVGRFTNYLNSLEVNDELEIEGPFGNFHFNNEKKAIFIAGGVGAAPIISILKYINENKIKGEFIFFYSNRTKDFPFYKELMEMNKNPSIKIIFTITREAPDDWDGETGRVSKEMISKYISSLKDYSAFLCGPVKMNLSLKPILKELGIDEKKIKIEAWS